MLKILYLYIFFYRNCNDIKVNATVRPIRYEVDSVITKSPTGWCVYSKIEGERRSSWCLPPLFHHRHYHPPILLAIVANWRNSNDNKLKRGNCWVGSMATWFRYFLAYKQHYLAFMVFRSHPLPLAFPPSHPLLLTWFKWQ